jgi:hypothetical protein
MRDHTNDTVAGNSGGALESDGNSVTVARGEALRDDAEYASLTRRAATDNSRALVDDVLRMITEAETRKRQRVSRAEAFTHAVEGFLGDLLAARGGWVYRPVGRSHFTDDEVSYRNFTAVREALKKLGLLDEIPWVADFGRTATRFSATQLKGLTAQYGIRPGEADKHFSLSPLVLKATSTRAAGSKIGGKVMKIAFTDKVTAMEQVITDLNSFLDQFVITGGTHRARGRPGHG